MRTESLGKRARRARAGVIGALECCTCSYPLKHAETETGHDETCQAHTVVMSARNVQSASGYLMVSFDIDTPRELVP